MAVYPSVFVGAVLLLCGALEILRLSLDAALSSIPNPALAYISVVGSTPYRQLLRLCPLPNHHRLVSHLGVPIAELYMRTAHGPSEWY